MRGARQPAPPTALVRIPMCSPRFTSRLAALGRHEDALATSQEATAIRRRLGEASSTVSHAGRLQHLATSLGSATCPASWSANAS
jgi:hypothetical protein